MTTTSLIRRATCLAAGAAIALIAPLGAHAGQPNAEVAVPRAPTPYVTVPRAGVLAGCWSAQRMIYGPYAFSFCSNGRAGSYQVRGGGLNCNGNVKVRPNGDGTVTVGLSRSRCNGHTDWSADYLVCRTAGGFGGVHGGGWNGGYVARPNAEVAVPRAPVPVPGGHLSCTYYPVAPGYSPTGLAMVRN